MEHVEIECERQYESRRPKARFILFVFLVLFYSACSPSTARDESTSFEQGILWSIYNPKSGETSYLIGTIHTMDTNMLKLPLDQLEELAMQTEIICLETVNPKAEMGRAKDVFLLKDTTQNIVNNLDADYKNKLLVILENSKPPLQFMNVMLSKIEPSLLTLLLTMEKQRRSPYFIEDNFSPEEHFRSLANTNEIPMHGLEEPGSVIESFRSDTISFAKRIKLLEESIDAFDKDNGDIYEEYFLQDLDIIPTNITEEQSFVQRNKKMVSSIDSLIENNSLFILVGAAHLSGENGILNLLHKKGFQLNNVDIKLTRNVNLN